MALSLLANFELDRSEFPDDLKQAAPVRRSLPRAGGLMAVLLIVALLPRAWMAWKVEAVTEDGPIYIYSAMQLARGDLEAAFRHCNLGLNLYPVVLWGLHELGLPWELAGETWGTLMAALVVLPMFGWIRRQFSDRVAAVACLLYSAHPALLERSPELLRCPTFWFLLMATVYFLWRAVTEVRLGLFFCAGACFTLGVHFRVETWFVLVPWMLWTIGRWCALASHRPRLLAGACLGLLTLPLFGLLLNVTWLRHQPQWEWCFTQRANGVRQLVAFVLPKVEAIPVPAAPPVAAPQPSAAPVEFGAAGEAPRTPRSASRLLAVYVDKLIDALDPLYALLIVIGLGAWRRTLLRADQMAMLAFCLVCLAGVAVFWLLVHDIQGRYFFPILLVAVNYAALGVFTVGGALVRLIQRVAPRHTPRLAIANVAVLATVAIVGCTDALTNNYDDRLIRRELGEWIRGTLGPGQSIVGSEPRGWALAWYAQGRYYGPKLEQFGSPEYLHQTRAMHPDVVLITAHHGAATDSPWYRQFLADTDLFSQFERVPAECLPPRAQHSLVFVRAPRLAAGRPTSGPLSVKAAH